jgi:hypothetical protein
MDHHLVSRLYLSILLSFSLALVALNSSPYMASAGPLEFSSSIRGGATGTISCPMGSSSDTTLSFIALSSPNGTVSGNWTLYNFDPDSQGPGRIIQGPVYSGNISLEDFTVRGETVGQQDAIAICDPPLFGPIRISGTCGREVEMAVVFQTDNPLEDAESFSGSADCQSGLNTNGSR